MIKAGFYTTRPGLSSNCCTVNQSPPKTTQIEPHIEVMPVPRTSRLVMKKVCSSCASLLETNWSYCIHCGASTRRPPQHQSELDASAAPSDPYRDLDQSTLLACSNPTNNAPSPRKGRVESKTASSTQQPGRANNIRRQPRLRQDESIDVHHQLQLVRTVIFASIEYRKLFRSK